MQMIGQTATAHFFRSLSVKWFDQFSPVICYAQFYWKLPALWPSRFQNISPFDLNHLFSCWETTNQQTMQKAQFFSNIEFIQGQGIPSKCRRSGNYFLVQCIAIAWVGSRYAEHLYAFVTFVYLLSLCKSKYFKHVIPLLTERHNSVIYWHCINVCVQHV